MFLKNINRGEIDVIEEIDIFIMAGESSIVDQKNYFIFLLLTAILFLN